MNNSQIMYYDLSKQERELALGYIVSILLNSRIACGKSDHNKKREDVDIYLAYLILSMTDPKAQERNQKYIYTVDSEIVRRIETCQDSFVRYLIYKTNADHILLSLSLFDHFHLRDQEGHIIHKRKYQAYLGRAKIYYELASTYHHRVYRKQTGICDVLDQLSADLEEYLEIVLKMRHEFFVFFDTITDTKFAAFHQSLKSYAVELVAKEMENGFLDAYSAYRNHPSKKNEKNLYKCYQAVKEANPDFAFDLEGFLASQKSSSKKKNQF